MPNLHKIYKSQTILPQFDIQTNKIPIISANFKLLKIMSQYLTIVKSVKKIEI